MSSCVLFAAGVNADDKLYVLHEYVEMLQQNFSDCDIYAGINLDANHSTESILEDSGLQITYERLQDEIFHVTSDASSFQVALKLMMQSQKKYDVVWFVHTKGGHNSRDSIRQLYMDGFFPKRKYIETKFAELEYLGVFGYRAGHYNWNNEENDKCLSISDRLIRDVWDGVSTEVMPYTFCKYIVIETMFAMNAEILYKYLEAYPEFFETPINRFPTGRWFIELELCNIIPTRMGYYPVVFYDYHDGFKKDLQFTIDNWIEENKLDHLQEYKTKLEDRYEHRD
jgi:hypothetical protein